VTIAGARIETGLRLGGRHVDLDGISMAWQRDVFRFVSQRTRIVSGAVRSIVWLVVLGLGLRRSFVPIHGLSYEQFLFPGIIAMAVIFSAIQSAISIIWDREFGFLREVLVAPVPRSSIVIGKALGGATTTSSQALIVLCLAPIAGVSLGFVQIVEVVPLIFLTSLAFVSLGIVIAARMHDFEGFGSIQNFVIMPLYLLSGAMFPLARTSSQLRGVVDADPLSYGVDAIRQTLTGYRVHALWADLLVLLGVTVVLMTVAVSLFNREG
jgi:ABC-2 type transport system permease protein